jgi:diguanylate cyclase (GGDEF)-like protein/PAS domain S-box-containing protein
MSKKLTYKELEQRVKVLEQDTLRRKQSEEELRESEEHCRTLFERSSDAIFIVDILTGKYINANHAAEQLTGLSLAAIKTKTTRDLSPKGANFTSHVLSTLKKNTDLGEVEYIRADGTVRFTILTAIPISGQQIIGIAQDITARKQTETALRESEQNLERAQCMSKIGSWYYDSESQTEVWSDACFKLFGLNKEDFPDNIVPEAVSNKLYADPEKTEEFGAFLAEKQAKYDLEFTTVPINGQEKTIHSFCEVEKDKNGKILKVFGTDHDISERIEAEKKLKESHLELSILYTLTSVLNESISIKSMLPRVLKTVTQFDLCNIKQKGGIFLVGEGGGMTLAAQLGNDKEFLEQHRDIKPGTCLCGLVAQSGKMIVSTDCSDDKRHTLQCSRVADFGHVIIPLKSPKGTEGVLYLYTKKGEIISDRNQKLLETIGIQIGIMIRNAKLYEETKSLSLYDPLTGLANRRMMDIHLKKLLSDAKRYNKIFFIMMLDIDYFKKYNDTFGHDKGDVLLNNMGNIFKKSVRESDFIARYGGEEFLIAVFETMNEPVNTIAERIRKNVEAETDVTISIGISYFRKGLEIKDLIIEADTALYKAKKQGRNRAVFLDSESNNLKNRSAGD